MHTVKVRFNHNHGDTDNYWRMFIDDQPEQLVREVKFLTSCWTTRDAEADGFKFHITCRCRRIIYSNDLKIVTLH